MDHPFHFRPNCLDETIVRGVWNSNEYGLPRAFAPADIVVDIGAHIGGFSYAALMRGCRHVFAYEAEPSNYQMACQNLASFGARASLTWAAVWRSDRPAPSVKYFPAHDPANTGGGGVLWSIGAQEVPAVALDQILSDATGGRHRRIRMLKLDCEGSEFPILLTSRLLHLVESIAGEFHELGGPYDRHVVPDGAKIEGYDRFTIEVLAAFLKGQGFRVRHTRSGQSNIGLFHAARPTAVRRATEWIGHRSHQLFRALRPHRVGPPPQEAKHLH